MSEKKNRPVLSDAQRAKVAEHVQKKAPSLSCPVCGHRNFTVSDTITTGNLVGPTGGVSIGGTTIPLAMLFCENCFHVLHFAAVPIGIVGNAKPEEPEDG